MDSTDARFMRMALALARRAEGQTRPNPPVGAVVVRGKKVVGRGYHARAGLAHAEVVALAEAGARAAGATLYVTLEPCCTTGRTPPCTDAIIAARIARIVAATADPNPAHQGKGFERLRAAGIRVEHGIASREADALIAPFRKRILSGLPRLILKLAVTIDGRIADERGQSRWLSSPHSRSVVQRLRRRADAVMVGVDTVISDAPSLRATGRTGPEPLVRVIIDSHGRIPLGSRVLTDGHAAETLVMVTSACTARRRVAIEKSGATVVQVRADARGRVALRPALQALARRGIMCVLCEGGGRLAGSIVRAGIADEFVFFITPKILGDTAMPAFAGGGWPLMRAPCLRFDSVRRMGPDVMIVASRGEDQACLQG